jgi:hypothetical protein
MNTISRRFAVSALALSLTLGCGDKKDIGSNTKTPATKPTNNRPLANNAPAKATPPEPAKPEVRVTELIGKVEVLKNANNADAAWAPLNNGESFDVADAPMFRVGPDAKLVISLPDDSKLTADPQTMFFFSENERREIALVSGVLDVQMKDKSTDRAGMQIRTTAGLVRGPQAAFTVGVNPLGDTMFFVERGMVYTGDEKADLLAQAAQAQEAIDAAAKGQEPPKIEKTAPPYTKVDPGKLALLTVASSTPQITPPTPTPAEPTSTPAVKAPTPKLTPQVAPIAALPDPSAAAVHTFAADTAWEAKFAKSLTDWLKAAEGYNKTVEENLAKTEGFKEQNLKQIEVLKAARIAKQEATVAQNQAEIAKADATITKIQSEITRSSRLLLALKRQAHLLTLESYLKINALDNVALTAKDGSDVKKALTTNEAKLIEIKAKVAELRQKTASLRPRTRIPANLNNPGARPLPPGLKIPTGSPKVLPPINKDITPSAPDIAPQ